MKERRTLIAITLSVVAATALLTAVLLGGTISQRPIITGLECSATPVLIGTLVAWEGDLRNPSSTAQDATLDFVLDGNTVRTRTYSLAGGQTIHFAETYTRVGEDYGSHSCTVRIR